MKVSDIFIYIMKIMWWDIKKIRRVHERAKSPSIKDPLLPRRVQSTPVSASSTQHPGSCWLGTARHFSHDMRGKGGSGVTLICVPVDASGETEDWGEFNISLQLYTVLYREIVIFCAAFCGNIRIFVATTVLPLSTLCGLLEISKCLWHWRWRRSESFALKTFHNLNGVI